MVNKSGFKMHGVNLRFRTSFFPKIVTGWFSTIKGIIDKSGCPLALETFMKILRSSVIPL